MPSNDKPSADDLELVKSQITQICNAQLLVLKEVHEHLVPMARKFGVELDAAGESAWAMSCWICLAQGSRAHWKMPTERLEKREKKSVQTDVRKPVQETVPFSDPNIPPALRKLRQMLKVDKIDEAELVAILRESTPLGNVAPNSLEQAPQRSLELLLNRWNVVRELVEAGRNDDGGEAA